jgi:uncharacterized protein YjbJ (UPF0337 family)
MPRSFPGIRLAQFRSRMRKEPAMKSGSRDKAEGFVDRVAGRILEAFSKLTGKRSSGAKGKAARARGRGRKAKGGAKKRAGR